MAAFTDYKPLDFSGIDKAVNAYDQKRTLAKLGQGLDGSPEGYAKAGQSLLALGDTHGAQNFFLLSEKARERTSSDQASSNFLGALGGGAMGTPRAPVAPAVQAIGGGVPVSNVPSSPRGVAVALTPEDDARLEAQQAGQTQFGNRNEPRGIRNNNPGNIEAGKFAATVQGFQGSDGRFAQYANPEDGIKAADKLLQSYAGRGLNTVAGIVNRWAPPTENNTGAYATSVAKELGVDPNAPLDMNNWEVRQKLIAAKIRVENGKQPYAEDVFQRALNPQWGSQVAQYQGQQATQPPQQVAQGPQFLGNAPPAAGQFSPQGQPAPAPVQTAQAPAPASGPPVKPVPGDDPIRLRQEAQVYAQTNPEAARQLNARADAAERSGGVQTAQAEPQAGAPVADMPEQGGAPAESQNGFRIPQALAPNDPHPDVPNSVFTKAVLDPKLKPEQRAYAQRVLDARQKYSDENAPDKREAVRLQNEKARLEIEKAKTPEGVREFVYYRDNGWTTAKSPVEFAREKAAGPSSIQEYEYEKRVNGFQGTLLDFQRAQSDAKSQKLTASDKVGENIVAADRLNLQGEDRKFFEANGRLPTAGEKVTEGQANAGLYADRMRAADKILTEPLAIAAAQSRFEQAAGKNDTVGSYLNSDQYKRYNQAKLDFITAKLRRESGAAISPTEFEKDDKAFFPQPGDPPGLIRQKAEARARVIEGIASAAGPVYAKRQGQGQGQEGPQGSGPQQSGKPLIQGGRVAPDGNTYVPDPNRPGKYLMVQP